MKKIYMMKKSLITQKGKGNFVRERNQKKEYKRKGEIKKVSISEEGGGSPYANIMREAFISRKPKKQRSKKADLRILLEQRTLIDLPKTTKDKSTTNRGEDV